MLCSTPAARKLHASMDRHILSRPRSTRRHFDFYETENYEVVRCTISTDGRSDAVKGLTFKFVGPSEHLT
jgi:hypothetical protein